MGILLQAFYWDCPKHEGQEFTWWNFVKEKISSLKNTGFTALWLPPASKAANLDGMSMGYDPYDFYDLGEFEQKGSVKTWFGSKQELIELIDTIHDNKMQVYADFVLNHNNGGDEKETNPIDKKVSGQNLIRQVKNSKGTGNVSIQVHLKNETTWNLAKCPISVTVIHMFIQK